MNGQHLSHLFQELDLLPSDAIDGHCHVFNTATNPALDGAPDYLRRPWTAEEIGAELARSGFPKGVLVQDADPGQGGDEQADMFAHWASRCSWIAGTVVSANLRAGEAIFDRLHNLRDKGVNGLRVVYTQDESRGAHTLLEPGFITAVKHCGQLGLAVDILARESNPGQYDDLRIFSDRIGDDVTLVLDHLLKPSNIVADSEEGPSGDWKDLMQTLAKRDNTVVKISGLSGEAPAGTPAFKFYPFYEEALNAFGPNRLVSGSDFTVSGLVGTHTDAIALQMLWLNRNGHKAIVDGLFRDNAKRVYSLK